MLKVYFIVGFVTVFVKSHPTMYKFNENKILEPDLVPVSSTVIPLPVYQVGFGFHLPPTHVDGKSKKPEGPVHLVTVHTKKKAIPGAKPKPSDISTVKQFSEK